MTKGFGRDKGQIGESYGFNRNIQGGVMLSIAVRVLLLPAPPIPAHFFEAKLSFPA